MKINNHNHLLLFVDKVRQKHDDGISKMKLEYFNELYGEIDLTIFHLFAYGYEKIAEKFTTT